MRKRCGKKVTPKHKHRATCFSWRKWGDCTCVMFDVCSSDFIRKPSANSNVLSKCAEQFCPKTSTFLWGMMRRIWKSSDQVSDSVPFVPCWVRWKCLWFWQRQKWEQENKGQLFYTRVSLVPWQNPRKMTFWLVEREEIHLCSFHPFQIQGGGCGWVWPRDSIQLRRPDPGSEGSLGQGRQGTGDSWHYRQGMISIRLPFGAALAVLLFPARGKCCEQIHKMTSDQLCVSPFCKEYFTSFVKYSAYSTRYFAEVLMSLREQSFPPSF